MRHFLTATGALTFLFLSLLVNLDDTPAFLPSPASADTCEPNWTIMPSPNPSDSNLLMDVAAVSPGDVWAVGRAGTDVEQHALAMNWDGASWSIVPSPIPSSDQDSFDGVTTISSNDVWAVGSSVPHGAETTPVTTHWDGTSWSVVPAPNAGSSGSLWGVAAVSSDDVWAVGYAFRSNTDRGPLTIHWDGMAWTVAPSPDLGSSIGSLTSVTAVSSVDVWAVGSLRSADDEVSPLIMHWDGTAWTVVPSPNPPGDNDLRGVAEVSSNDVWAVGLSNNDSLIMHWDGTAWTVERTPSGAGFGIEDVAAFAADDVWAVGYYHTWRWDGTTWSVAQNALTGPGSAVTIASNGPDRDVWAVGYTQRVGGSDASSSTLTALFCGPVVAESPSPTSAPSPSPASSPAPVRLPTTGGPPGPAGGRGLNTLVVIAVLGAAVSSLAAWNRTRRRTPLE